MTEKRQEWKEETRDELMLLSERQKKSEWEGDWERESITVPRRQISQQTSRAELPWTPIKYLTLS